MVQASWRKERDVLPFRAKQNRGEIHKYGDRSEVINMERYVISRGHSPDAARWYVSGGKALVAIGPALWKAAVSLWHAARTGQSFGQLTTGFFNEEIAKITLTNSSYTTLLRILEREGTAAAARYVRQNWWTIAPWNMLKTFWTGPTAGGSFGMQLVFALEQFFIAWEP